MTNLIIFVLVIVAAIAIAVWRGNSVGAAMLAFVTIGGFARQIFVIAGENDLEHIGIANAALEVQTYQLALLFAWLFLPIMRVFRNIPIPFALLVPYLLIVAAVEGDLSAPVGNGILHVAFACIAWGVGAVLAELHLSGRFSDRALAITLLVPVVVQAGLSVLQLIGIRDVGAVETGGLMLVRINGGTGHPGTLGKLMFLLLLLVLPLTLSRDRVARILAWTETMAIAALVGLTFGRANVAAVGAALAIWIVLGPGRSLIQRIVATVLLAVCAIPVILVLLQRSAADPEGGRRPQLVEPALAQIEQTFWFGVGPNDYVRTVGEHSPLTALGYSVHDTFLLALVEFGAVGMALFMIPMIVVVTRAVTAAVRGLDSSGYAIALIAMIPGVVLNAVTGWGLLQAEVFVLMLLVIGFNGRATWIQKELDLDARLVGAESRREARARRRILIHGGD